MPVSFPKYIRVGVEIIELKGSRLNIFVTIDGKNISGIKDALFETIKDYITV